MKVSKLFYYYNNVQEFHYKGIFLNLNILSNSLNLIMITIRMHFILLKKTFSLSAFDHKFRSIDSNNEQNTENNSLLAVFTALRIGIFCFCIIKTKNI